MLDEALEYAKRGWAVMPLDGKRPATAHGWKDADTDVEQIVAWFAGTDHNVGIATGLSDLLVVDLDGDDAVEWWLRQQPTPTAVALTGRGQHWYYRGNGPSTAGRIAPGVDTRGRGGYVVAPPSLHPLTGAAYRWQDAGALATVPGRLRDALTPPRPARRPKYPARGLLPNAALSALATDVRTAPPGTRNDRLNLAAYDARTLLTDVDEAEVVEVLVRAGTVAGLGEDECRRTVASGLGAR